MDGAWSAGLHRRSFISTHQDDIQDTIRLVSPINRFRLYPGNMGIDEGYPEKPYKFRTKVLLICLGLLVLSAALAGFLIGSAEKNRRTLRTEPADPYEPPLPSASKLHTFKKAAVCTDATQCSKIGRSILMQNGSAVDAAIAAMFCNGILNSQSMGLGGGFFMTVYIRLEERAYTVNAREAAPGAASKDMYQGNGDLAMKGPLAVAVPGELRGMWAAYQRWGKLPWASLIAPTLQFCTDGFTLSKVTYDGVQSAAWLKNDPRIKKQFYDADKNDWHKPGTRVKPSEELCNTLKRIAENGGDELYNGTLARDFAEDLMEAKTIITEEDLRNYQPIIEEPLAVEINQGDTLYTPPPPSSGVILANILNILSGYNFSAASINSTEDKILTYHRIIEAFKFAYGTRTKLGDAQFLNLTELIRNATDPESGMQTRLRINDSSTSNDTSYYGATEYLPPDSGTAHISIIAANGDAVSITSSINFYFGAGFTTRRTGLLLNNVMDDFSSPGVTNYFGLKPAPANFIEPYKRPLSSMTPSIIVDRNGNAKMVIGASGGTKITTAVALTTIRILWFEQTIKQAVDEPRFHHQTIPMRVDYEYGITEPIVAGLRAKGHAMKRYRDRGSIVCALYRNSSAIIGNADFRKGGDVSGLD